MTVAVLGGVGGKALFDFLTKVIRDRRAGKAAESAENVSVLTLLTRRITGLEAAQVMERAECEKKLDGLRTRHDECETRLAALDGEMKEVRRSIGLHRPDDTQRLGPKKETTR